MAADEPSARLHATVNPHRFKMKGMTMPEHKGGKKGRKIGRNLKKCARYALTHPLPPGRKPRRHGRRLARPLSVTGRFSGLEQPGERAVTQAWQGVAFASEHKRASAPLSRRARNPHPWPGSTKRPPVKIHGWVRTSASA